MVVAVYARVRVVYFLQGKGMVVWVGERRAGARGALMRGQRQRGGGCLAQLPLPSSGAAGASLWPIIIMSPATAPLTYLSGAPFYSTTQSTRTQCRDQRQNANQKKVAAETVDAPSPLREPRVGRRAAASLLR